MSMHRWITALVAVGALLAGGGSAGAQGTTTGAIAGTITEAAGGGLEAAQVEVVNAATGFRTGVMSREGGRYFVQGLDVGADYQVTVRRIGYAPITRENIRVALGQATRVDFVLEAQAAQLSAVEVTAAADAEFGPTAQGVSTIVSDSAIRRIPQLDRDPTDLVRLSPQVASPASGAPSAAGAYNRFNNYTIDGGNQNDRFNLGSTEGQPGGSVGGRLISPEAIKEVQVVLSPTDVRYGNFAGMLVNAVTRNGTNTFTGGAIYSYRSSSLAADEPFIREGDLDSKQYGFQLGGPIIRDRLHFFVAPEWQRRSAPNQGPAIQGGASTVAGVPVSDIERIQQISEGYGFDPGGAGVLALENPLTNLFGRLDWQINDSHRMVFRQLVNRAEQIDFSRNTGAFNANPDVQNTGIRLTSNQVPRENKNNSTVVQLFSNFANGASNELSVGYNTIEDVRNPPVRTPEISINTGSGLPPVTLGTEQFSPVNILEQDILEITNNFTIPVGAHALTVGARYETNDFNNDFRQRAFGSFKFNSINDYEAGTASAYSIGFGNGGPIAARFKANIISGYVQDQWSVTPNLSLTYGVRVDVPRLPDSPAENSLVADAFRAAGLEVSTSNTPKTRALWSPRAGFNWDVGGRGIMQVRGNAGVYTGQAPFVMIGNAYQNTGLGLVFLNCGGPNAPGTTPAFTTDVDNLPQACAGQAAPVPGQSGTAGINLTDPNFKYPQAFVASAGFDRRLPGGIVYTLEGLYRNAINGLLIRDLNLRGPRFEGTEFYRDRNGRVLYADTIPTSGSNATNNSFRYIRTLGANNVSFSEGAVLLTNQSSDYSYSLTNSLRKQFGQSLELRGAYTFMHSRDVQSLTSDRAVSNYRNGRQFAGLESDLTPTTSYFDRPHRVMFAGSYTAPWKRYGATDFSLFYEGISGTPFTIVANGDLNGDLVNNNDPIYIPRNAYDPNEIQFSGDPQAQQEQRIAMERIIQSNECLDDQRGKIMARNSCRSPFQHRMDASIRQSLPEIAGQNFTVQLDIFNVLNLLNDDWGEIRLPIEAPDFPQQRLLAVSGRTPGPINQSQPIYSMLTQARTGSIFAPAPNRDVNFYRMQLTFRYAF